MADRENLEENLALLAEGCAAKKMLSIRDGVQGEKAHFNEEIFQDLRELLGDAYVISSLLDLSYNLDHAFRDPIAKSRDRQNIFKNAHYFIARAGIMGFASLHDTCIVLQNTCMTDSSVDQPYLEARAAAIATRNTIRNLIIQTI
ncbi:MAG: hypothetical protein II336_16405 [Loktanella sp.]|nr:hypothetical protein [Loktanella sp.]